MPDSPAPDVRGTPPARQVRAVFDDDSVTVYQAYAPGIARRAVAAGRFVSPFKVERMTWIKPSFLWMMYRCGWATKPQQERVLAVRIARDGFEQALRRSCLSHFDPDVREYVSSWTVGITDITGTVREIRDHVDGGRLQDAGDRLPREEAYPLPDDIARMVAASR